MDGLTWFGLVAVSLMLLCYALETRAPVWTLGFAGACVLGSAYGFLQGAWPFGLGRGRLVDRRRAALVAGARLISAGCAATGAPPFQAGRNQPPGANR